MLEAEKARKANVYRVIYIGLCFLVLFCAFISAQNLIAQIYSQLGYGSLGQICLFLVWGFMGLTSVVAAHYKKKISTKTGLYFGAIAHISLIGAGVWTTFCSKYDVQSSFCQPVSIFSLNVLSGIFVGIGAAILWLSQAVYVNECADENTKGLYNGLFWSIFQTAQILSGILATFILGMADQFTFYVVLLIFGLSSLIMLSFIQEPISSNSKNAVAEPRETLSEAISTFYGILGERRYFVLFAGLFFSGIAIGCYISFIGVIVTNIIDSDNVNVVNQSLGLVLLVLAIGEVSAGLSAGRVADMYDKLKVFSGTMIINEVALFMTILALLFKSYPLVLISGFLWGYGDTAIQTLINAVIGSVFKGRVELYSAYKFFQGFGCMYSAIFSVLLPKGIPIIYLIFIAGSLTIFHVLYHRYLPISQKTSEHLLAEEKKLMIELKNI